jgi:uncharacterized protein YbcC (UPF0753/DUF2309 family)
MKVEFETSSASGPAESNLNEAIAAACARIAPLWPLQTFVAVNPFLGFSDRSFAATAATFRRVARVDMLMPRAFYAEAIAAGLVEDRDLEAALAAASAPLCGIADTSTLKRAASKLPARTPANPQHISTVAEILDALSDDDRLASHTAFMIDEISRFFADYFDEGQAIWRLPARGLPLYAAWRETMRYDRNADAMGLKQFRSAVAAASADPRRAIAEVVAELRIPQARVVDYLHRALLDIGGWAAYGRYLGWSDELDGRSHETLTEMLAVRLVWGYALFLERKDAEFALAWTKAIERAVAAADAEAFDPDLAIDLALHEAYERAFQRRWIARMEAPRPANDGPERPAAQAVFCIDVRSEIFRRALETAAPEVETLGFAGFFGFAIDYRPFGTQETSARCPVLLKPSVRVCEAVEGANERERQAMAERSTLRNKLAKAWKGFKLSAVSSFGFVETAGPLYLIGLAANAFGLARSGPVLKQPESAPDIASGLDLPGRIATAEAALRGMSLTANFAPIVLIVGHGGSSVNNPHAASLHCGACGGHTGDVNARVAAAVLNDPAVREGLEARGVAIPTDTWFVAALHDTTVDEVRLFGVDLAPASHRKGLAHVGAALERAGALTRAERAGALGVSLRRVDADVASRSRDWSQVRPEWALAGNAAFIAAPRRLTRRLDLGGRAFLHSYEWGADEGFKVLDVILTAPLVVASWINLQYFGSTVNNQAFGAGNKTLHNVVGTFGVIEGAGGDLRAGLPWQSVHDGEKFMHDPVRLNAFVAAPREALLAAVARHAGVRDLIDNGWVNLFALDDEGRVTHRYRSGLAWEPVA